MFNTLKQYIEQRGPLLNVSPSIEHSGPQLNKARNVQYLKKYIEQKGPLFNVLLGIEHSEKCHGCSMARLFNK